MEKFYLEAPGVSRKEEAIAYIREFREYGSQINGAGGLNHFLTDYDGWLRMTAERGKGYNKINLYLGLKVCSRYGIKTVMLDADLNNPASWRTMEALGGVRVREYYDDEDSHGMVVVYHIDTDRALAEHPEYEEMAAACGTVGIRE